MRKVRSRGRRAIAAAAAILLAASCEMPSDAIPPGAEDLPSTILWNFQHTIVKKGLPQFRIVADRAENYDDKRMTKLFDVGFVEYDEKSNALTAGSSDTAVMYTDTENVELDGVIDCRSNRDGLEIQARYLYWDNQKKLLRSRTELQVTIKKDDGSSIRGSGFQADGRSRDYGFSSDVTGYYAPPPEDSGE
jgi:LPS export ABC transporter protein LptC